MNQINQTDGLTRYFGTFHWFVIHTKPRDEHRVKTHLLNQEIEAFLPLFETHQYLNGKMVRRIKPLFPNYLFAKLDLERHYYKVKWTRGVSKILGTWDGPVPISEKVVQMIKERMSQNNVVRLVDNFQEGDLVQITSGPLKEFIGVFQRRLSSGERVRILLNLIGAEMPVQISRWQLKKVA